MTLILVVEPLSLYWAERPAAVSEGPQQVQGLYAGSLQLDAPLDPRDEECVLCHTIPEIGGELQGGDHVPLYIDREELQHSVHGTAGIACVECHVGFTGYPHHADNSACVNCHPDQSGGAEAGAIEVPFVDRRAMDIALNDNCRSCHQDQFSGTQESFHEIAKMGGNRDAPMCVDCHGGHDITPPDEPRLKISETCAQCHRAVYTTYRASVHGTSLAINPESDAPTCIDCHGVHSVRGPRDMAFRNDSITVCGGCHGDTELMAEYNISTDVFTTYLGDFHGRTVDLFRRDDVAKGSSEAVCYDCHGVHNILSPEDPNSSVYPDNLQRTCQQCHGEASIRFPDSWLSHYLPTWENTPLLFVVNWFYQIIIPLMLFSFFAFVLLDVRKRRQEQRPTLMPAAEEGGCD